MRTIENTPLGPFEISWGLSERQIEELCGPLGDFETTRQSVSFLDPLHGELKSLGFYRHKKNSDRAILLGEITNGIWAGGLQINGKEQ